MNAPASSALVVGLNASVLPPSGWVVLWRQPVDLRLAPEARALLAQDPAIPAPTPPLPSAALRRSASALVSRDPQHFVRSLSDSSLLVVHQQELREGADADPTAEFEARLRVQLNVLGQLEITPQGGDDAALEIAEQLARDLRERFAQALHTIAPPDVTRWLTRHVLPSVEALPIRTSSGGVYFVPRTDKADDVLTRVGDALARSKVSEFARLLGVSAPDLLTRLDQLDFEQVLDALTPTTNPTPIA